MYNIIYACKEFEITLHLYSSVQGEIGEIEPECIVAVLVYLVEQKKLQN